MPLLDAARRRSFGAPLSVLTTAELAGAFRPGRRGPLARLLGFVPVPTPPHVFEVDSTMLRYASFARRGGELELERVAESTLPVETFQPGPLSGPLRGRESFDRALDEVLPRADGTPTEASLVLPDRWLRLLFTDLEEELADKLDDEMLRFKLKRLVPFRVDELRVRASVVPAFPGRPGQRLFYAFSVEQLLHDLEAVFQARGLRIGQIASRTLYLVSLLRGTPPTPNPHGPGSHRSALLVHLESDGYSLSYLAEGVPYVFRYRPASVDLSDESQSAQVGQDLRILLGFIAEHLPSHGVEEAIVCGPAEAADAWVDLLQRRFELPSRRLEAGDLPATLPPGRLAWNTAAPLVAAATREVA